MNSSRVTRLIHHNPVPCFLVGSAKIEIVGLDFWNIVALTKYRNAKVYHINATWEVTKCSNTILCQICDAKLTKWALFFLSQCCKHLSHLVQFAILSRTSKKTFLVWTNTKHFLSLVQNSQIIVLLLPF